MENQELKSELHAMKSDIQKLRTDLSDFRDSLKEEISDRTSQARDTLASRTEKAKDAFRHGIKGARQKGGEMAANFEESVVDHPFGTLAAAFSIGFIVAKLLDHENSHRNNN